MICARARGARALHDREPDAAEAEHEHGRARLDPAVLSTAPTPVCTAHPMTHAISSGVSSGTLTAPVSLVIAYSANPPTPRPAVHLLSPPRDSPVDPSRNVLRSTARVVHAQPGSPRWHQ